MNDNQFPILGKQFKHFDDGVDIAVDYTRHGLNITYINSVRYSYNLEYVEVDYYCSYTDFINSHPKVRISRNMIDVEPRVRQMMEEVESELRSADERILPPLPSIDLSKQEGRRATIPAVMPPASVIDIGLEAIESELGFTLP